MNGKNSRRTQSFRRVQQWIQAHPDVLQAAPAQVAAQSALLDGIVAQIETAVAQQGAQHNLGKSNTTQAATLRAEVRAQMRSITQVARGLKGTVVGISAIETMPDPTLNTVALVAAADTMAQNATTFKESLVDRGLAPDFIDTLLATASSLKASGDAQGQAISTRMTATKGIAQAVTQGTTIVSFIDAALLPQLRKDPVLAASWRHAKGVTAKGVAGSINPPASPTPGAAAPSTTSPAAPAQAAPVAPVAPAAPVANAA